MMKTQEALSSLRKNDATFEKALESTVTDLFLQEALNAYRSKNGQP